VLRLVLPKGSLERATLDLFEAADLAVQRSDITPLRAARFPPTLRELCPRRIRAATCL